MNDSFEFSKTVFFSTQRLCFCLAALSSPRPVLGDQALGCRLMAEVQQEPWAGPLAGLLPVRLRMPESGASRDVGDGADQ